MNRGDPILQVQTIGNQRVGPQAAACVRMSICPIRLDGDLYRVGYILRRYNVGIAAQHRVCAGPAIAPAELP